MSKRDWRLLAEDILDCSVKIEKYIGNMEFQDFVNDEKTIDAVVRNLEIIGEVSKYMPVDIKEKYQNVNWKGITGLRNRIIHEYFGVDFKDHMAYYQRGTSDIRRTSEMDFRKELRDNTVRIFLLDATEVGTSF